MTFFPPNAYRTKIFLAFRETSIPFVKDLTVSEQVASMKLLNEFVAKKPPRVQRKLRAFCAVIDIMALLRMRKHFYHLDIAQRSQLMSRLLDSRVSVFRKGFWGVNALAKLSIYGLEELYPRIHFTGAGKRRGLPKP